MDQKMSRTRLNRRFGRHRYEIGAAVVLTITALGFLAAAALNYKSGDAWPNTVKFEAPRQSR